MGTSNFTTKSLGYGPALKTTNAHGVNSSRFSPDLTTHYERNDFGIADDSVVFIIVAQLYENDNKGQLTFTRALSKVSASRTDLHLLLLGGPSDGILANKIADIANNSNLSVHFAGPVDDVEKYYPLADVAVSARLTPEPFGLSVVEAMLMGKPVLVHASGGPAELIDNNVTGWHSPTASVSEFENAIVRCLSDRMKWNNMGVRARDIAVKCYSVQAECERWLAELRKISDKVI